MASLHFLGWWHYILWQLAGFAGAVVVNSFIEWAVHKFLMHRRNPLIPYGFLHQTSHHGTFGAHRTYIVQDEEMMEHGLAFTWREFILFPLLCLALYGPVEVALGKPILLGAIIAVFAGLLAFQALHYNFHCPASVLASPSWFSLWIGRRGFFVWLREHHRRHHEDMGKNLNVVFPLADLCMGTLDCVPRPMRSSSPSGPPRSS